MEHQIHFCLREQLLGEIQNSRYMCISYSARRRLGGNFSFERFCKQKCLYKEGIEQVPRSASASFELPIAVYFFLPINRSRTHIFVRACDLPDVTYL